MMGQKTEIEWCDSTANPVVGCSGCELWAPRNGVKVCYAGNLVERYAGRTGWPVRFEEPLFKPEVIPAALRWSDLTGTSRPGKPWLDGLPRLIFWCDMSDALDVSTVRDGVGNHWLIRNRAEMAASRHQHLILTKRGSVLAAVMNYMGGAPQNFWLGVSVTGSSTLSRVRHLVSIRGAGLRFLSVEPAREYVDLREYLPHLDWVIWGGESGPGAPRASLDAARRMRDDCADYGVAYFVKQVGTALSSTGGKGGNRSDIPADLWIRQMPAVSMQERQQALFA